MKKIIIIVIAIVCIFLVACNKETKTAVETLEEYLECYNTNDIDTAKSIHEETDEEWLTNTVLLEVEEVCEEYNNDMSISNVEQFFEEEGIEFTEFKRLRAKFDIEFKDSGETKNGEKDWIYIVYKTPDDNWIIYNIKPNADDEYNENQYTRLGTIYKKYFGKQNTDLYLIIDGVDVYENEYNFVKEKMGELFDRPATEDEVINNLTMEIVIYNESKKSGITVSSDEIIEQLKLQQEYFDMLSEDSSQQYMINFVEAFSVTGEEYWNDYMYNEIKRSIYASKYLDSLSAGDDTELIKEKIDDFNIYFKDLIMNADVIYWDDNIEP